MSSLAENLRSVQDRIRNAAERAGRDPAEITLVAVSKTFPAESVIAAHALGVRDFGENRVEEAADKIPSVTQSLSAPVTWHMVGHIQHRKVREAATLFDLVHSVDTAGLASRLNTRAENMDKTLPILLEVNISGEESKYGFRPEPRRDFYAAVDDILQLAHLDVQGLMTVAPIVDEPGNAQPFFAGLRQLRDDLRLRFPQRAWSHLSMGMTDDFEVAIAEGATLVRIGRAIFGERAAG